MPKETTSDRDPLEGFITVDEAAALLRYHRTRIEQMIHGGEFNAGDDGEANVRKVGRRYFLRRTAVEAKVEDYEPEPAA